MSIAILISGRGSNMQALVQAGLPVSLVLANEPGAAGLAWAGARGIATRVLCHRDYPDREAFDADLARAIDASGARLVVLAGFMRVLTDGFVDRYPGRLLNIHPSLLPAFPGLHTHRRALEAGVRLHGCTVHFVTRELDGGPAIVQAAVPVLPEDDEDRLAARVLACEHRIYPDAVARVLAGSVRLHRGRVLGLVAGDGGACLLNPPPAAIPPSGAFPC